MTYRGLVVSGLSRKIAESDFGWTKSSQKSLSRTNLF
jgi:hypothetical protein